MGPSVGAPESEPHAVIIHAEAITIADRDATFRGSFEGLVLVFMVVMRVVAPG